MRLTSVLNSVSCYCEIQLQGTYFTKQCSTASFPTKETIQKYTLTSVHKDLAKLPLPQKRGRGVSIVPHSQQAHRAVMGTAQAQMSSWEIQCPCWTRYPCCQHQGTWLAQVHADQIQLECKDNTVSFEEKTIRFLKEANIAQNECWRKGSLMNREKKCFNSGSGSSANSHLAVHRQACVLTVMWSKTINGRLCISGQESQQRGRSGRKGEMCQTESSASRTTALHLVLWNKKMMYSQIQLLLPFAQDSILWIKLLG